MTVTAGMGVLGGFFCQKRQWLFPCRVGAADCLVEFIPLYQVTPDVHQTDLWIKRLICVLLLWAGCSLNRCPWQGSTFLPLQWYLFSSLCLNLFPSLGWSWEWTSKDSTVNVLKLRLFNIECQGKKVSIWFNFWRWDRRPHRKLLKTLESFT